LRLEKSMYLMSFGKHKSLTTIALDSGFSSSSDFTRCFKLRYGVAPSKFDLAKWIAEHGKRIEAAAAESPFRLEKNRSRANPDQFRVHVRELPRRMVAYVRVSNPYQGDGVVQAAKRLMAWADARQVAHGRWLGYQFESPKVTPLEFCHYCVAVEVETEFEPKGEIGLYRFPAMLVAEVEMKGGIDLEIRLLQWLYGSWLPRSKYVPADQPCFEAWLGQPFEHGLEHFELNIHLPIKQ
jgi:AraC family transcriptional regulator